LYEVQELIEYGTLVPGDWLICDNASFLSAESSYDYMVAMLEEYGRGWCTVGVFYDWCFYHPIPPN